MPNSVSTGPVLFKVWDMAEEYQKEVAEIKRQIGLVEKQVKQVERQLNSTQVDAAAELEYLRRKEEQLFEILVLKEKAILLERGRGDGRVTLEVALCTPFQPLSYARVCSSSSTKPAHPHSPKAVEPWPEVVEEGEEWVESLVARREAVLCPPPPPK